MKRNPLWLIAAVILFGCSEQLSEVLVSPGSLPINLTGSINQQNLTRANEQGFVTGDRMGIYIVDYVDGRPGQISTDNRASNVIYTFDGENYRWTAPTTIYWRDNTTPVDVYGYYPAANYISDPSAFHFEVSADQSLQQEGEMSSYEASDFLWGKTAGTSPTTETIMVRYSHRLAGVRVQLLKGEGLTDTEWQKLPRLVTIDNTIRTATIDLATGTSTPTGSYDRPIRMLEQSGDYRAVIIPQTVEAGKTLISITIDGTAYSHRLTSPMKYQAGKLHNFTITVNKNEATGDYNISVSDDGITDWINDEASHQFSAQAFVVVHCDKYGTLKECITRAGLDYKTIENLKVTGELTTEDFSLLHSGMPELKHLNLKDVQIKNIDYSRDLWDREGCWIGHVNEWFDDALPKGAFYSNKTLRSLILPSSLKRIGNDALREMSLMYSTLEIPEGVTNIGDGALAYNRHNGMELILPSSIDTIGAYAFSGCGYECEFKFHDNIEFIGEYAFGYWDGMTLNFHGVFHIPSKLRTLTTGMFAELGCQGQWDSNSSAFTGDIEIPQGITEIPEEFMGQAVSGNIAYDDIAYRIGINHRISIVLPTGIKKIRTSAFPGLNLSSIRFNDDLETIESMAFLQCNMPFEIHLPRNLTSIGGSAFSGCHIEGKLEIPENCLQLGGGSFVANNFTEIVLPSKLELIPDGCFSTNSELKQVIIPKYVNYIGERAFGGCPSLQTVICLNPEPPTLNGNVWGNGEYWGWHLGLDFDKCVLEVPEQSVELYRHTDGWKDFKNITAYHELAFNIPEIICMDKGATRQGILRAEGEWEICECPSWITVTPSSGNYKDELAITIAASNESREGRIVFRLKDRDYTTYTTVRQIVSNDYHEDATVTLQTASAGGAPIPIFLVGEGYGAEDITSGKYLTDMKEQMSHLFSTEPYKTYRNYFTVSTAYACSPESGMSGLTKFKNNNDAVWQYARDHGTAINNHATVMVLCNTSAYLAHTDLWDNGLSFSWLGKNTDFYPYDQRGDVLHYLGGRGFGKLGPEYVNHFTFMKACTCGGCNMTWDYERARSKGWWQNVSITPKMTELPWQQFIFHEKYSQYVDVYEGALNHARSTYRSENQSVMGSTHIYYYNTISRYEIVQRIMEAAGKPFSLEQFVANDKIEIPEE